MPRSNPARTDEYPSLAPGQRHHLVIIDRCLAATKRQESLFILRNHAGQLNPVSSPSVSRRPG